MKNLFLVQVFVLAVITSCTDFKSGEKISELETQLDSAAHSLHVRDSILSGYLDFVTSLENRMNEIRKSESMVSLDKENYSTDMLEMRDRILTDIETFDKIMDENREKIQALSSNLKGSKSQVEQLKNLVLELKTNMEKRENEIAEQKVRYDEMTGKLTSLNHMYDSLYADNLDNLEMIRQQKDAIIEIENTSSVGYYATGTLNELKDKNIIEREGGILGIGAVEQLNQNLELTQLQGIDIRNVNSIPINSRKAELITNHPHDSYQLVRNGDKKLVDKLLILDPQKFWASSKCLVVITK